MLRHRKKVAAATTKDSGGQQNSKTMESSSCPVSSPKRKQTYFAAHYPISGIMYLVSSPTLWGTVLCVVIFGIVIGLAALILLFTFTFHPQAEAFGGGKWWSYLIAVFVVLAESLLIAIILLKGIQTKCQNRIFVKTMKLKGKWREDMAKPSIEFGDCCSFAFILSIVTLPLLFIPLAGFVLYAFINAPFAAKSHMELYFNALKMDSKSQTREIYGGRATLFSIYAKSGYTRFGFVAALLEKVPIAGPSLFCLTNACGAALWACDMENNGGPPTLRSDSSTAALYGATEATAAADVAAVDVANDFSDEPQQ